MPSVLARIETILARLSDPRDDDTEAQQAAAVFGPQLKTILQGFAKAAEALRLYPSDYSQYFPEGFLHEQIGYWLMDSGMVFCNEVPLGQELLALRNDLGAKIDLNRTVRAVSTALERQPQDQALRMLQPLLLVLERDFDGCLYSNVEWVESVGRPLFRTLERLANQDYEADLKKCIDGLFAWVRRAVRGVLDSERIMPRLRHLSPPAIRGPHGRGMSTIPERIDKVLMLLLDRWNEEARCADAFFGPYLGGVKKKLERVRDAMIADPHHAFDHVPSDLFYEEFLRPILLNGSRFLVDTALGGELLEIRSEIEERVKVRRALRATRAALKTTPRDPLLSRLEDLLSGLVRDFDGSLHPVPGWYGSYGLALLDVLQKVKVTVPGDLVEVRGYVDQLLTTIQNAVRKEEIDEWLARGG